MRLKIMTLLAFLLTAFVVSGCFFPWHGGRDRHDRRDRRYFSMTQPPVQQGNAQVQKSIGWMAQDGRQAVN